MTQAGLKYTQEKVSSFIESKKGIVSKYIFNDQVKELYWVDQDHIMSKIMSILFSIFVVFIKNDKV
jgi:hypothetical protein